MKVNLKTHHDLIPILMEGLRTTLVALTFTKKDGTTRIMKATLAQHLIPEEYAPKGNALVVEDIDDEPTFVRVFDTEELGWRTVIFDNVNSFAAA